MDQATFETRLRAGEVDFSGEDLSGLVIRARRPLSLAGADLTGAVVTMGASDLTGARLRNARVHQLSVTGDSRGVDFTGADIGALRVTTGASLDTPVMHDATIHNLHIEGDLTHPQFTPDTGIGSLRVAGGGITGDITAARISRIDVFWGGVTRWGGEVTPMFGWRGPAAVMPGTRLHNGPCVTPVVAAGHVEHDRAVRQGHTVADLTTSEFTARHAVLAQVVVTDCRLPGADFTRSYVTGGGISSESGMYAFRGCDLRGAVFTHSFLDAAGFEGCDLTGADMTGVVFTGHVNYEALMGAHLTDTVFHPTGEEPVPEHVTAHTGVRVARLI